MAVMPKEVQDLFNNAKNMVLATSTPDGVPNAAPIGMKKVIDDETVYVSDQFFKKTLANVQANPKVCVVWWGDEGAYELYGTARYVNEGPEFESQAVWVNAAFEQMGMPVKTKGGVYVHVDEVYTSAPGPHAGDKIA